MDQIDAALNLNETTKDYVVAFDPLSSAPHALAPAPAIALPLGAAASEPALCWTRRHAPAAGHAAVTPHGVRHLLFLFGCSSCRLLG